MVAAKNPAEVLRGILCFTRHLVRTAARPAGNVNALSVTEMFSMNYSTYSGRHNDHLGGVVHTRRGALR